MSFNYDTTGYLSLPKLVWVYKEGKAVNVPPWTADEMVARGEAQYACINVVYPGYPPGATAKVLPGPGIVVVTSVAPLGSY